MKSISDISSCVGWDISFARCNQHIHRADSINQLFAGVHGTDVYVLDAKYYKYGVTGKTWDLPESTSINKQITYGEYIANEDKFKKKHGENMKVYNAFLMPFDSLKSKYPNNANMLKVGQAVSNWKDNTEEYHKIQGVLLDVKTLMSINVRQEMKEIEKLAKLIEN